MVLSFSFSLIVEPTQVDLLLKEVASCLCDKDARRLSDALPWQPAFQRQVVWGSAEAVRERRGIGGMRLEEPERELIGFYGSWGMGYLVESGYDFSFVFPADVELEAYLNEGLDPSVAILHEGNKIDVGYVNVVLHVGDKYALLTAVANGTFQSRLFGSSPSVINQWLQIAARSSALALYFDTEDDHDWLLLHPDLRTVAKPLEGCFWSQDLTILRVDAYCAESLHLSHLPTMEF